MNIAATLLDYWRDGQHLDRREVVAGEPDKQTPQIQAPIINLVAYPKWHVPDSISSDELSKKSQAWLQENQFAMENGKFVQESGPENSLGIVKFDMDDKQSIYLTTPRQRHSSAFPIGTAATAVYECRMQSPSPMP